MWKIPLDRDAGQGCPRSTGVILGEIIILGQLLTGRLAGQSDNVKGSNIGHTAGLHYCCTAQDSLNGDQLTANFEVHLEKHA